MKQFFDWLSGRQGADLDEQQRARRDALPPAQAADRRPLREQRLVVLDLETTGVSWYRDTIIEFGAVKVVDRKPVDTYQQLVNPMRNLNPFITQLTGITPDMLEPAPTLDTVLPDFLRWCGDDAMIGHNIMQFDIKFIDLAAQRILHHAVPNRIIDTLQMSRSMYPQYNRHRLVDLIQRFDIADVEEHRALSDAEQTQMCFEYMRDEQRRRDC